MTICQDNNKLPLSSWTTLPVCRRPQTGGHYDGCTGRGGTSSSPPTSPLTTQQMETTLLTKEKRDQKKTSGAQVAICDDQTSLWLSVDLTFFYLKPGWKASSGSHGGDTQVHGRWDWGKKLQRSSPLLCSFFVGCLKHKQTLLCLVRWALMEIRHSLAVWSCCILLSSCIVSSSPLVWLLWRKRRRRQVRWFRDPVWETREDGFRGGVDLYCLLLWGLFI